MRLRLEIVAGGLDAPRDIAFAPDGRMFVAEQTGRVRVVRDGRLLPDPALVEEVANTASGGGLLAIALDPGFDRTHFVYALSTTSSASGGNMFRLARFREANDTLADRVVLLDEVDAPAAHAAAALRFGADGKLYATFDDGGNPVVASTTE